MPSRVDNSLSSTPGAPAFEILRIQIDPQTCAVSVEGELDLSTAPRLKWMLIDALEAGETRLVLDLSRCPFMDSTALGVLVGFNRSLHEAAGLAVVCDRANVLKIFELSGMDGTFAIFPTLDQALAHLGGRAGAG